MRLLCVIVALLLYAPGAFASIGSITKADGPSTITREANELPGEQGTGILSMDKIQTYKGGQKIDFIDETRLELTPHSRVTIDEFVYDPANDVGSLSVKAGLGTVRYASGQIAKKYKQNVKIRTPSAVIGVRGTDFTMTIDETGSSMIVLLPSCDGNGYCFVGEISVESDTGQVILNQAFQATIVETLKSRPLKPIKLLIDESLLNNILIVSKPKEFEEEKQKSVILKDIADALDIDFLQYAELERDYLEETEEKWYSELDIDFLAGEFLQDILEVINRELAKKMRDQFDQIGELEVGYNPDTGITFVAEPSYIVIRDGGTNYVELRLSKDHSYEITIQQNDAGVEDARIGDGINEIDIIQSN
jgi:hypothetical protein